MSKRMEPSRSTNAVACDSMLRVLEEIEFHHNDPSIIQDLLRIYDNLRPSYSANQHLEFGGIALTSSCISEIVQHQVDSLIATGVTGRILVVWKKRSALLYMQELTRRIEASIDCHLERIAVQTRWLRERTVELVHSESVSHEPDYVLCVDSFIGTGNTFQVMHNFIKKKGLPKPINLALADLALVEKDYLPKFLEPIRILPANYWLFGFNSDCLSNGVEHGRRVPFLGFLVPFGTGIRDELSGYIGDRLPRNLCGSKPQLPQNLNHAQT